VRRSSRVSLAHRSPSRSSPDTVLGRFVIMPRAVTRRRPHFPRRPVMSSRSLQAIGACTQRTQRAPRGRVAGALGNTRAKSAASQVRHGRASYGWRLFCFV
jgi:hypothetical protein